MEVNCETSSSSSSGGGDEGRVEEGAPPEKRFRLDTQLLVEESTTETSIPVAGEVVQEGASPAAPSSASYRSSNGSVISDSPIKEDEEEGAPSACEILHIISQNLLGSVFSKPDDLMMNHPTKSLGSLSSSPTPTSTIPGAVAVAQSPAAALFAEDDWSWHRNPAAAIRSGGTNKQTPVWKYFVYNKAENLSRCIIGDCTYMLKGPHTSTLACHLKKHTKEYGEFQRLKAEYSRTKVEVTVPMKEHKKSQSPLPEQQQRPKPKKDVAKINELNAFMRKLHNGSPPDTTPTSPGTSPQMPNLMMMGMNPLQMMLAQSSGHVNAAAALQHAVFGQHAHHHNNNNNNTPATPSTHHLAAAGLTVTPSGQIVPSRKWRREEKKQREVETRLALALATSHVPFQVLQNWHWKELFEVAQPKFQMTDDVSSYEHILNATSTRMNEAVRATLQSTSKLVVLVDAAKLATTDESEPRPIHKVTVSVVVPTTGPLGVELQTFLLGFRNVSPQSENVSEGISKCVEQVLADYEVNSESIVRIVCSGIGGILGDDECNNVLDKQMESFGAQLLASLNTWLESNSNVDALKRAIFSTVFSIITNPAALASANRTGKFDLPLTEPLPILLEAIISLRQSFNLTHIEGFCPMSDAQWSKLQGVHNVCNLFKSCLDDSATVDTAIPTIQKVLIALDKDLYQLGEMAGDLKTIVLNKMSFVLDPKHDLFDPSFLKATTLNPQLAMVLSQEQLQLAKKLLSEDVSNRQSQKQPTIVESAFASVMRRTGAADPMSLCEELFQQCVKKEQEEETMVEAVTNYFAELSNQNSMETIFSTLVAPAQPPLNYWRAVGKGASSQALAEIASELLIIPTNTVSAHRVLSFQQKPSPFTAMEANLVVTNIENPEQLEKQLVLRFNRSLINKIL